MGGGGQPIAFNQELASERAAVLNALDGADTLRLLCTRTLILRLSTTACSASPFPEKAEELLRTNQAEWDI